MSDEINVLEDAVEATAVETAETMEDYANELEASFRKINEGDIISGTVISVTEEEVTLDLKYYASGIIKISELSNDPNYSVFEEIHEGDVLSASVIRLDDGAGNLSLSMRDAQDVLAWDKLIEYKKDETILHVTIGGIVNAGVITYVEGIRGFIPASQLSLTYVEDLNPWLKKEVDARVITVDPSNKKLVLSAKSVERERSLEENNRQIANIVPGIILEGTVETLMPYGAFVSLSNGLSGLVHISQISQKRIKKPSEVLTEGETVKVKVLNTDNNKLSLSIKALQEDLDAQAEALDASFELPKTESISTSLGDLLSKFKL